MVVTVVSGHWRSTVVIEPDYQNKSIVTSQWLFTNPERGWIAHRYANKLENLQEPRDSKEKVSLLFIEIDISKYKNSKRIGKGELDEISAVLGKCPKYGLKVMLRSASGWTNKTSSDYHDSCDGHAIDLQQAQRHYHGCRNAFVSI